MIRITRDITLDEDALDISFIRASGPGGQNVNKLSTAVQLRYDVTGAQLAPDVEMRLKRIAGRRLTKDNVIVIEAQQYRTQERNKQDAIDRLVEMIREASVRPTPRRPTKPTFGSKQRRLEGKKLRSNVKKLRQDRGHD